MEAKKYTIYNKTRDTSVTSGATAVDSTREPLTALRVMVEGLGSDNETGLWLTHITVIPMVPRISPFDLVYLDKDNRVFQCIELLPATEIPRFSKPATSALVLPFRTISATKIAVGDDLTLAEIEEVEEAPKAEPIVEDVPAPLSTVALITAIAQPLPEIHKPVVDDLPSPFLQALQNEDSDEDEVPVPRETAQPGSFPVVEEFAIARFLRDPSKPQQSAPLPLEAPEKPERAPLEFPSIAEQLALRSSRPRARAAKPVTQPQPDAAPAQQTQPASATNEAKPINRFFRWLYPALYDQNRRASDRRNSQGLVAYDSLSEKPRMHEVGDLSSNGLYLRTSERWEPGTAMDLILQRKGRPEKNSQERIELEVVVVRTGADGVGFAYALPEGLQLKLWEAPGRNGANEADPGCVLRELRMARALAFMCRICPSATEEITALFYKTLSNVRLANVVEIALKAERLLVPEPHAYSMVAHRDLILRILEHGSWVDVAWLQELWAGLLATSCTLEGQDESNLVFIDILSRLAPLPTQILAVACAKAMQAMGESSSIPPSLMAFTAEEIARITRSNNLTKIYRSIAELSELGLLEKSPKAATQDNPHAAKAKPTHLGLEMFARCNGQRGAA